MAALCRFRLLRRSSPSSLLRSFSAVNNLLSCRYLPFSTVTSQENLECHNLEQTDCRILANKLLGYGRRLSTTTFLKFIELHNLEQTDGGIFAKKSILDGLPFDSISKSPGVGCLTISRRTKDEIIEIRVEPYDDWDCDGIRYAHLYSSTIEYPCGVPPLIIRVEIKHGNNFDRGFYARCSAFYEDKDQIDLDEVTLSYKRGDSVFENSTRKNLEEFEDFFKNRGIELCNFSFLFDYFHQKGENQEKRSSMGISTSRICNQRAPPVAYHNIADKIENDIASYTNETAPLPNDIPFRIRYCFETERIVMERRYQEEDIEVLAEYRVFGDNEYIELQVNIMVGDFDYVRSVIIVQKNRVDIQSVWMRNIDEKKEEEFLEFLKNRGITTKTMGFLWNSLRFKRKNDEPSKA